ncbi:uncharacterized protein LOC113847980 [Abrus precatorius]|uniref:Uncharacterized protein LOC113847980 n=1 Tax=Abrus precatorius TaxID=3816 RepID=A0A8B8JRD9_ABRPR|nr:uncharacterized protein LOC113847980 [Abrus precatorius]
MEQGSVWYTENELQIAHVLLDFHDSEPPLLKWGRKRKRSATQDPLPLRFRLPPASFFHGGAVAIGNRLCETVALTADKGKSSSPSTPLSFSPSESEEKPKASRRKPSLRKRRECYLKIIEDLTEGRGSLNQAIEKTKGYYDQLKAFNLKLKARKQELMNGPKGESKNTSLEFDGSMELDPVNATVNASESKAQNEQQKQPELQVQIAPSLTMLNQNHMCGPSQSQTRKSEGVAQLQGVPGNPTTSFPGASSSGHVSSKMSQLAIPDLNLSPPEFAEVDLREPLDENKAVKDLSRAMAAQARQKRIQIFRLKNFTRNTKPCSS